MAAESPRSGVRVRTSRRRGDGCYGRCDICLRRCERTITWNSSIRCGPPGNCVGGWNGSIRPSPHRRGLRGHRPAVPRVRLPFRGRKVRRHPAGEGSAEGNRSGKPPAVASSEVLSGRGPPKDAACKGSDNDGGETWLPSRSTLYQGDNSELYGSSQYAEIAPLSNPPPIQTTPVHDNSPNLYATRRPTNPRARRRWRCAKSLVTICRASSFP